MEIDVYFFLFESVKTILDKNLVTLEQLETFKDSMVMQVEEFLNNKIQEYVSIAKNTNDTQYEEQLNKIKIKVTDILEVGNPERKLPQI